MGFIPGLIAASLTEYKSWKSILKAELFVIIGVLVGMAVASISEMWVSGADIKTVIFGNFIPSIIPNLINGLILVPILMVAYNAIVKRSGR
jgi:energy-coupling factor transport system substrate-specific component